MVRGISNYIGANNDVSIDKDAVTVSAKNAAIVKELGLSTEPYYRAGDLARAFNNLQTDVLEKVVLAGKMMTAAADFNATLAAEMGGLQDTWSPFDFASGIAGTGKALVSSGLKAGERAVFYSGGSIAKEQALIYARNIGGRTNLQTPIGKALEVMKAPDFAWRGASEVFASTAKGEAHVFLGEGASWSRTFGSVEAKILEKNGTEIVFH